MNNDLKSHKLSTKLPVLSLAKVVFLFIVGLALAPFQKKRKRK